MEGQVKKTVLIDARTGGDWSLDLLMAGLIRRLGPENVVDCPVHDKHREGPIVLTMDPMRDWGRERRSLGYTPHNDRLPKFSRGDIMMMLQRGEIERIFLDERLESYNIYLSLQMQHYNIPVVVIAGHDRFWNDLGTLHAWYGKNLEHVFLDNWDPSFNYTNRVSLFNWSVNFDHYWNPEDRDTLLKEKVYDISFMGYNSHPDRARFVDHILRKWSHLKTHIFLEREPDTMRGFVPKREYFKVMAQSKICLNLRGAAQNGKTLRYYEIPYVGSFMLSQDSGAKYISPQLEHGWHCGYFANEEELDDQIEFYLKNDSTREMMAKLGHELTMKHHTVDARTDYIYRILNGQK